MKNFGGVPLITGFLLPEEIQGITRASAEDVYKFIEDDLKAAADVLPQRSQYAATDMGRATRGAALGYWERFTSTKANGKRHMMY